MSYVLFCMNGMVQVQCMLEYMLEYMLQTSNNCPDTKPLYPFGMKNVLEFRETKNATR
jgi:hypothetical protein